MREGRIDEQALLRLARQKSAEARARLAATISDLFLNQADALTERERALMADILRRVLRDIEISVRRQVAAALADQDDLPHDLMVFLANDESRSHTPSSASPACCRTRT